MLNASKVTKVKSTGLVLTPDRLRIVTNKSRTISGRTAIAIALTALNAFNELTSIPR